MQNRSVLQRQYEGRNIAYDLENIKLGFIMAGAELRAELKR